MTSPRLHAWGTAGWTLAVWFTLLNGIVVGYGALWFQFGGSPDADDYRMSAGGYAAAAAVLLLSLPALLRRGRSGWLVPVAVVASGVLGSLAAWSALRVGQGPSYGYWPVLDGVGGVLWAPWTWLMVALGLRALSRSGRTRPSTRAPGSRSGTPAGPARPAGSSGPAPERPRAGE